MKKKTYAKPEIIVVVMPEKIMVNATTTAASSDYETLSRGSKVTQWDDDDDE